MSKRLLSAMMMEMVPVKKCGGHHAGLAEAEAANVTPGAMVEEGRFDVADTTA